MRIFLIRHGIARDKELLPAIPDDERPLTDEGRKRLKACLPGFKLLIPQLDVMLSSPLLRAKQTANLITRALSKTLSIQIDSNLAPDGCLNSLRRSLLSLPSASDIALVGHEPCLSELAAILLGSERSVLSFKKGGACCIDVPNAPHSENAALLWHAPPKLLRALQATSKEND